MKQIKTAEQLYKMKAKSIYDSKRYCKMCEDFESPTPILSIDNLSVKTSSDSHNTKYVETPDKEIIEKIKKLVGGCPTCTLASMVQLKKN